MAAIAVLTVGPSRAVTEKNASSTDLAAASVAHAGNAGTFGPKTSVDGNGQVTFQVLPGSNTLAAWDGTVYKTLTVTVTGATSTTISIS
jgi:hypothetical protein